MIIQATGGYLSNYVVSENDYLAHYGTKGQKWGVRKYQNEDGTLTEEGRRHYYGDSKRQEKSFNRDMKKLRKLEDKTNMELQAAKYERNKRKAHKSGIAAAAMLAGGATALGAGQKINMANADIAARPFDTKTRMMKLANGATARITTVAKRTPVASEALGVVSSALGTAALVGGSIAAGKAFVHAVKADKAKRLLTSVGHDKAVRKYNDQITRMQLKYSNTSLSEITGALKKKNS